jgi:3-deoxy-7-phosphoheptulonate synthase
MPGVGEVLERLPLPADWAEKRRVRVEEIRKILSGAADKWLLLVGPCSADDKAAVLEYASRLARLQEEVRERAVIVPRLYTSKPRTTGEGYKGMLHQPDVHQAENIVKGVFATRDLHLSVIRETGLFGADEMLYPELMGYLKDLLAYTVVGARSVEDQQHRLVASGLDIPVGMKNPMNGELGAMLNSIHSAQHSHHFVFDRSEVESDGNAFAHAVLRGYLDGNGQARPNYHYESLLRLHAGYGARNLQHMAVIVDCNHHNSGKQYLEQIRIAKEVKGLREYDGRIREMVKGLMIESYLEDGRQNFPGKVFGQSITDACLGWEKTDRLIREIVD